MFALAEIQHLYKRKKNGWGFELPLSEKKSIDNVLKMKRLVRITFL